MLNVLSGDYQPGPVLSVSDNCPCEFACYPPTPAPIHNSYQDLFRRCHRSAHHHTARFAYFLGNSWGRTFRWTQQYIGRRIESREGSPWLRFRRQQTVDQDGRNRFGATAERQTKVTTPARCTGLSASAHFARTTFACDTWSLCATNNQN